MWYYIKDKNKEGPLSDAAFEMLFKKGEINKDTLVWTQGQREWEPLSQVNIHKKFTSKKKNTYLQSLRFCTLYFRVLLFVFMLLFGAKIFMSLEKIRFLFDYIYGKLDSNITIQLKYIEFGYINRLIGSVCLLFFILILFAGFKWVRNAARNAARFDSAFSYTPQFAAFSFFIPFVNLLTPFKVMLEILSGSLASMTRKISPFDLSLVVVWFTFNICAIFLFVLDSFIISFTGETDMLLSRIVFSISTDSIILMSVAFWIILVSRITFLQKKFYTKKYH